MLWPGGADDAAVLAAIRAVKSGGVGDCPDAAYRAAARHLVERGAGLLVIACTELSVIGPCSRDSARRASIRSMCWWTIF